MLGVREEDMQGGVWGGGGGQGNHEKRGTTAIPRVLEIILSF